MDLVTVIQKFKKKRLAAPLVGYPGIKLTNTTVFENLNDPNKQFETIKAIFEECKPDIVFPFMDLSVEAQALGLETRLSNTYEVVKHPVKSLNDLNKLELPKIDRTRMIVFVETIKKCKENLPAIVGGYIAGPFTLASLLVGVDDLAINTLMNPDFCHSVLSFTTDMAVMYAQAQQQAGADLIVLLEASAVFLSPKAFEDFVGKYVNKVCEMLKIPVVLHVCGDSSKLIKKMCETSVQGLSLDSVINMVEVSKNVPDNMVLIGNISPVEVMLKRNSSEVYKSTMNLLEAMEAHPYYIPSTGCDVPGNTPIENVVAFCKAVRDYNTNIYNPNCER